MRAQEVGELLGLGGDGWNSVEFAREELARIVDLGLIVDHLQASRVALAE